MLGVVGVSLACVSSASAAVTSLASLTADSPISARSGWLVWSVPSAVGWRLMAWHAGAVRPLPAAPRPQPFDVNLGTDGQGRAVATYSRCARTPTNSLALEQRPYVSVALAAWAGRDCRVYAFDLASGREQRAAIPHPRGTSDTFPSMWHGRIAFARYEPSHLGAAQIELWTPRTKTLQTLPHGSIPTACPNRTGCRGQLRFGAVDGLSLNGQLVAYKWFVVAPGVIGHGGWELRADRLSGGHSLLVGSGFIGEACTGGPDAVTPLAPVTIAQHVLFGQITDTCYAEQPRLLDFNARTQRTLAASVAGEVVELTTDGSALYALIAPQPAAQTAPTCSNPGSPCTLEQLPLPATRQRVPAARPPLL